MRSAPPSGGASTSRFGTGMRMAAPTSSTLLTERGGRGLADGTLRRPLPSGAARGAARSAEGGRVLEHRLEDACRERLLPADRHCQGLAATPPTAYIRRRTMRLPLSWSVPSLYSA